MNNLEKMVEEFFALEENLLNFETLATLIEEQMNRPRSELIFEAADNSELTIAMIPEIPISEIGWGKLTTGEGEKVDTAQRTQLYNFLKNIGGNDLQERIANINSFYTLTPDSAANLLGESDASTISRTLSYLTFFKTLTTIITNFNAASAGFAFEAFLGVLLGGTQIPPGHNTIADLTTEAGVPISLKLYNEASIAVGGSYTDLVNDLVSSGYMQYVVVMKNLAEQREGDPLSRQGALHFYRFNFNLDNISNILSKTKAPSIIQLPKQFLRNPELDMDEDIPQASGVSIKDLESKFAELVSNAYPSHADQILQSVNWANRDELYVGSLGPGRSSFYKGVGKLKAIDSPLYNTLEELVYDENTNPEGIITREEQEEVAATLHRFNDEIVKWRKDLAPERDNAIRKLKWASVQSSVEFYNALDEAGKKRALKAQKGYLFEGQFHLNKTQVKEIEAYAQPTPGEVYPAGQDESYIGTIEIGADVIINALNNVRSLINSSVFDIFNNLKVLTTNIQSYFAEGLEDDRKAENAITAADNIESSTEEIRNK